MKCQLVSTLHIDAMISVELKRFELQPAGAKYQADVQILQDFIESGFLSINSQPDKQKYGPFTRDEIGVASFQSLKKEVGIHLTELLNGLVNSNYLDSNECLLVSRFLHVYTGFCTNRNANAYQLDQETTAVAIASGLGFSYFHSLVVVSDTSMDLLTIWWD